ncbi:MAG: hypothetical protein CVV39_03285 [Planctomycetes bacterium HGW-Planctomycetes-1]|nr:MAG: hypothetical protein CVV39_03285 [Planctomycetes bacterium HGW-Planctomycetes-1]
MKFVLYFIFLSIFSWFYNLTYFQIRTYIIFIIYFCRIDKIICARYTFPLMKTRILRLFSRGVLPEYWWMNVPEAFLWIRLPCHKFIDSSLRNCF